ncbi:hypothetical protein [Micromonospora rosaria]|uniref:hypothetical protein n=1 Tax=Micromonospora rosaria TaxID=47874 RepID=UPI0012FBD405|nr:hypothetical protein [Micromonospora rosaria]
MDERELVRVRARLEDFAAGIFAGLRDWQRADAGPRLRAFADAYGLTEQQRRDLVPLLTVRTRAMHDFLRDQAALAVEPWATHWRTGHGDAWRSDAEYTERHTDRWLTALLN